MVHEDIYFHLKELARLGWRDSYTNVGRLADLKMKNPNDRRIIGRILSKINEYECREGRPLLSAVVVRKDRGVPGNGFYRSAVQLGLFPAFDDKELWRKESAQQFWQVKLDEVFEYWSAI